MKTDQLIQFLAIAGIGYLAYQKMGKATANTSIPNTVTPGLQPSQQQVDFGITNASDAGWGDNPEEQADFWATLWGGL